MPDIKGDEFYEADSSDNEENHSKLLSSVSQLDSTQRVKAAQRKEATARVSEYTLTEKIPSKKNLISINELANVLGKSSKHGVITKKLKNVTSKSKTLPKPLEKPFEEQIKRSVGFQKVKTQLQRWDAVVTRNALKDHIQFPLNDNSTRLQKSDEFLSQFKSTTPLEEEIAKVLNQNNKAEKQDEEDKEFTLTLEEMLEKRREMAYLRAKLSYKEAKAQRQSKIKSKKYHRILKREKLRQQLKEFDLLQKTDPEAALKKLSELDKTRAQERASLRHRNTGQWAKNLTVRAKYDTESRKILAEQLKISRELTQKVHQLDESSGEETEESVPWNVSNGDKFEAAKKFEDNPWNLNVSKEVKDFVSGYKKYWSEQNKAAAEESTIKESEKETKEINIENSKGSIESDSEIQKMSQSVKAKFKKSAQVDDEKPNESKEVSKKSKLPKQKKSVSVYPGSGVWIVTPIGDESDLPVLKKRKGDNLDILFEELDEKLMFNAEKTVKKIKNQLKTVKEKKLKRKTPQREFDLTLKHKTTVERPDMDVGLIEGDDVGLEIQSGNHLTAVVNETSKISTDIDPKNFIQVKPKKLRTRLPEMINGEENEEKTQVMSIEEAFVDDDVIAEFKEMKEEEEKSNQIETETSLPGWGSWGGLGVVPKARKKSRLVVNVPPRKDKEKKDTIINENANPNLKNHLVKEVPHPFQSVEAFEANIRNPVGREWVPETAHWKLIQKHVETKLGAVIDPMDEEEVVKQEKSHKSPYQGQIKNKKKS